MKYIRTLSSTLIFCSILLIVWVITKRVCNVRLILGHFDLNRIIEKENDFDLLDDISLVDFPDVDEDLVLNIVGDTNGDIRSVIYSDMPIEGEHCVFDLFDDVPFEC